MRVPLATYRVQLHAGFGFDDAAAIADYLHALGISHLYSSPALQAGKGSTHGYDVLNHNQVSKELGGPEGHDRLCWCLGENHLGFILDIVPNHMSIAGRENAWWWDVLENGQSSRYASYFDVDWHPPEAKLHDTVLMPVLGDHYGRVLEAGELKLVRDGGSFTIVYHDHVMPVAPRSLNDLLARAAEGVGSDELAFLADSFGNLPLSTATDPPSLIRRHRDKEVLRRVLARLCWEHREIAQAIDREVGRINESPSELDALLERQNYRLAYWRTAGQELDYRRFFDINTLVSLRIEERRVFEDTHVVVLDWVRRGVLDGLRVDHPDGLLNPKQYVERLHRHAPDGWIVVEKILEPGERLPGDWPVAGTTGYDFLNRVTGLLVDPAGEGPLTEFFGRFTGITTDYPALVRDKKHLVLKELFGSDLARLTSLLVRICERQKRYRDYTRRELNGMLREVIACFPVYRTYIEAATGHIGPEDRRYIDEAIEAARRNRPEIDSDLFDFFRDLLQLRVPGAVESELVMRFQQHTGPVMAKGVEDTVFYNYNRLIALNEVGGDPGKFSLPLEDFHAACRETHDRWPTAMLASTTHDTKRSEDVRARIALLSEIPAAWAAAVERWAALNERHRRDGMPDRNLEYLLYQTLVGAWPIEEERLVGYVLKAIREAKAYTSWNNHNAAYEEAATAFAKALLASGEFREDLMAFLAPLVAPGRINSLSQTLLKLTTPGVPDLYQGTELWALSLVDPDNRRPVDYDGRRRLLAELEGSSLEAILSRWDEGLPKLHLVVRALHLRRRHPAWFGPGPEGAYTPLRARGPGQDHVVAYRRGRAGADAGPGAGADLGADSGCIAIAPRLPIRLGTRWDSTTLAIPPGAWRNELTGESLAGGTVAVAELLGRFPVALLSRARD
jgi:(1->4)-alpha-D-glucan 1-alpha-D-glucosylmutase